MKKILTVTAVAALLSAMAHQAPAQERTGKPALVVAETNVVKATVEDIDLKKREVTLKDEEGNKHKMKVGEEARNLDQVKKGDLVVAKYYQSAAVSLHKPGETPAEPQAEEAVLVAKQGQGQKPGGVVVKTTQVTATVEDVDYAKREVKLKDDEGNTRKIKVGDRVKKLEDVKKGDQVVARYTEALALSVEKPQE
jgi:hypothetical protein